MDGSGAGAFGQANVCRWASVSERDRMRDLSRMVSLSNFDRMHVHEPHSLPFRDATWSKSTFDLHVKDCWSALQKASEVRRCWCLRFFSSVVCFLACVFDTFGSSLCVFGM
jgi:hypothetical protein